MGDVVELNTERWELAFEQPADNLTVYVSTSGRIKLRVGEESCILSMTQGVSMLHSVTRTVSRMFFPDPEPPPADNQFQKGR